MKKLLYIVFALGIFLLVSCNNEPSHVVENSNNEDILDSKDSIDDSNDESSAEVDVEITDSNTETPKEESVTDSNTDNNEEKNNDNEPGELNDDGWKGKLF